MKRELIVCLVIVAVLAAACQQVPAPGPTGPSGPGSTDQDAAPSVQDLGDTQQLRKFSSWEELQSFLQDQNSAGGYGGAMMRSSGVMMDAAMPVPTAVEATGVAGGSAKAASAQSASDYSQTNVQVAGVDEADFLKNDAKYIYAIVQDKLVIVDAYPAASAKVVSKTQIDGQPRELFVDKDRLVLFSQSGEQVYAVPAYDYRPQPRYTERTHVLVYDISDRAKPELVHDYAMTGGYYQSRMIGSEVYLLTQGYVSYGDYGAKPRITEGAKTVVSPEIYYFDNPEDSYQLTTVASFDAQGDASRVEAKSFLMGYATTLYVSEGNIYVAYQKNLPYRYYEQQQEDRFWEAVVPALPADTREDVLAAKDDRSLTKEQRNERIALAIEDMYAKVIGENGRDILQDPEKQDEITDRQRRELQDIIKRIDGSVQEWEAKRAKEQQRTVIQRLAIDDGAIDYKAKGEVAGHLLNQFSMDEYAGKLRVATTTDIWTSRGSNSSNAVYVLDGAMETVGSLEGLAESERIYSTRFMGDRLYMVTFRRIDPLFVIDLSGKDPEVLGKLKIPGYSDYLHPIDETHLIGVGKETDSNEWGGTSIKGLKVAVFDVSDVEHPRQSDYVTIGGPGTDSEALNDHKAFLFDAKRGLLVLPVRMVETRDEPAVKGGAVWSPPYYRHSVWQGAYVFEVTPTSIEEKGRISHYEGDEDTWYWGGPYAVRRSLFMDDVLYTVSSKLIEMNDIGSLDELGSVRLPYKQEYYPQPYYGGPVYAE